MGLHRHRGLVDLLLLVGTLAAILGAGARWVDTDLLDTAQWTRTSGRLIADPAVRRAVSGFTVQRTFGAAGIDSALDRVLPPVAADPAQRALHRAAAEAAGSVLSSAGGRRAWRDANRQAVSGLLSAVDHPGRRRGVSLQLTPLLSDLVAGVAANPIVRAIPGSSTVLALHAPDAGRLQLLSASEVRTVAPGVRAVRVLAWALPLAALLAFLLALALAQGWRVVALSRVGYALLIAGGVLLGLRALLQFGLADLFVGSATDRAGVRAAWLIATVDLRTDGIVLLVVGGIVAVGSWLMRAILR